MMRISIIIPTLNEERALPTTLQNIAECARDCEVIIVDGGSTDRTREMVASFQNLPMIWMEAPRGRGSQMNAAAARASGDVLLFLHADTHLPPGAPEMIRHALADPQVLGGNFRIRFAPSTPLANFYAWCYNLRSHTHVFYGDSALFVRKEVFDRMGGYRAERVMEDFEFVLRLRREGRLAYIRQGTVTSSARRFSTTGKG
ncbi:MAG TPA: TIGR04283 family arsenosugar biosynthesis glycosyltransferase, partial [Chthonomonadales bacterium]|nr:TIGR04283 family arsenosugar biosynthesis glycosyltransferase [Chthonomonadales bacterium]